MKQKTALLLSLILLLSLLSCGKAEEDDRGFDAARSFAHFYSSTWVRETTDTLYFLGWSEHYIKYADKATGISGVLCGRPECRHNDKNCNAYVEDARCLLMDGGRLYWMAVEFTDSGSIYVLYSMALDGTDRRKEAELPEGFIPSSTAAHRHYLLYDGWLYFGDVSSEIVNGEQILYNYVAAAPIGSKQEPFVILKEETMDRGYSNLAVQFYKGDLYILTCEPSPLSGDEKYLYDCTLRRWNAEMDELETLYEDESVLNWSSELWVTDDGVLFNRNTSTTYGPLENRIYKYHFDSGECEYLFDNGIYGWANMGLIADGLVSGHQITDRNDGTYDFYVMLKDFEGNVLVDETYTLDIRDEYANYDIFGIDFVGRDEEYAYYSTFSFDEEGTSYVSLVSVALDGGGAQVVCTQAEARSEQWASGQIS